MDLVWWGAPGAFLGFEDILGLSRTSAGGSRGVHSGTLLRFKLHVFEMCISNVKRVPQKLYFIFQINYELLC